MYTHDEYHGKCRIHSSQSLLRLATRVQSVVDVLPSRPPPRSQLFPLVVFFAVLAGAAWVGWHIYLSVSKMSGHLSDRMGKSNVVFTKDGVRVGVKHVADENEVDATQRYFVNAWNLSANKKAAAAARKTK